MFSGLSHFEQTELRDTLQQQPTVSGMWHHAESTLPSSITVDSFTIAGTRESSFTDPVEQVVDKKALAIATGMIHITPRRDIGAVQRRIMDTIVKPAYQLPISVTQLIGRYGAGEGRDGFVGTFPPRNANPTILYAFATRYLPVTLPRNFNWVDECSSVVDQLACGGCWAVSVAGALADRIAIWARVPPPPAVSVTSILACVSSDRDFGALLHAPNTLGCNGGFPSSAAELLALDGAQSTACAPYTWCTTMPTCVSPPNARSTKEESSFVSARNAAIPACATMRGTQAPEACVARLGVAPYADTGRPYRNLVDIKSMQQEIIANGPIVGTYAVYEDFLAGTAARVGDDWAKTSGVYCNVQSGPKPYAATRYAGSETRLTGFHAVVIVGWGVEEGVVDWRDASRRINIPFWLLRNSWGRGWNAQCKVGDRVFPGYFKCAMTDDALGINTRIYLDNADDGVIGASIAFQPAVARQPRESRDFDPTLVGVEVALSPRRISRLGVGIVNRRPWLLCSLLALLALLVILLIITSLRRKNI